MPTCVNYTSRDSFDKRITRRRNKDIVSLSLGRELGVFTVVVEVAIYLLPQLLCDFETRRVRFFTIFHLHAKQRILPSNRCHSFQVTSYKFITNIKFIRNTY